MLFLAVFPGICGGEYTGTCSRKKKGKEYAISLLTDIKKDVIELEQSIKYDSLTSLVIDSLVHFIGKGNIRSNSGQFYYLSRMALSLYITDWNRAIN
jgi:hypothetical protein